VGLRNNTLCGTLLPVGRLGVPFLEDQPSLKPPRTSGCRKLKNLNGHSFQQASRLVWMSRAGVFEEDGGFKEGLDSTHTLGHISSMKHEVCEVVQTAEDAFSPRELDALGYF
jgi:hypothetical protein